MTCTTSDLGDLHMHGKIRRLYFQWNWFHGQLKSELVATMETRQISKNFLMLCHLALKLMYMTCTTSDLGDLHMHGKIRRLYFQWNWFHGQLKSELVATMETRQISKNFLMLCHLFWAGDLCIELESTRDVS
jgi:hypothetical protein